MCDYCDCRTRPPLERLGRDHERIVGSAQRLRARLRADDRGMGPEARALQQLLEEHDRWEEAGLYAELDRVGLGTAGLRADHEVIHAILGAAADGSAIESSSVLGALDQLEEHIHREEYDLFPAAHQVVDDAGWDRIERALEVG